MTDPTDPTDPTPSKPPPRRPRLLVPLALLTFVFATITINSAWWLTSALTGSQDGFERLATENATAMLGLAKSLGTPDELQKVAARNASSEWSRRGMLIPLAGASAISALLMLVGAMRTLSPRGGAWGRAAWQLGSLIAIPCLVLDSVAGYVHARDLVLAVADLKDPLSTQLRAMQPLQAPMLVLRIVLEGTCLAGVARYLASDAVLRYCAEEPRR